ncbi:MAG: hypothetical protein F4Y03_04255 [Alphaproteobacteria bacterium]|nr:hypothetical protein [Alphaproteobacteria bacterium]
MSGARGVSGPPPVRFRPNALSVMPGLVPGIHFCLRDGPDGDTRNKSGHDGKGRSGMAERKRTRTNTVAPEQVRGDGMGADRERRTRQIRFLHTLLRRHGVMPEPTAAYEPRACKT